MADEDEGMEGFDISEADMEFALNPGRRHYQSKNQATYGIWADKEDDSDEEEQKPSFGRKRQQKNYSAPVNFVSGGIKVGNKMEGDSGTLSASDEPIEINLAKKARLQPKQQRQAGAHVFAGMRRSNVQSTIDETKFGDWAKNGKGSVIMNMMRKMGYEDGSGLGKDKQGIVEPVQAALRPGRAAIGAYGKEATATGPKFGESAAEAQRRTAGEGSSTTEKQKSAPLPKGTWKKTAKVKTVYRTIDDVIKDGGAPLRANRGAGHKVIDMTGPEQRIYSGYDAFSLKTKVEVEDSDRDTFDVPELTHNINLLLDLTEEDIRRNNQQLGNLKDQTVALEYDLKRAAEEHNRAEKEREKMKGVYDVLEDFTGRGDHTMNNCQDLFRTLKSEYADEYYLYHLEAAAIPLVLPLIRKFFTPWQPLDPDHLIFGVDLMKEWKEILEATDSGKMFATSGVAFDKLCAFDRLLWDGWMPCLRRAALDWDPRDQAEQMIRVIKMWLPVLPRWMRENLLDQVIVPRIAKRVEDWDPLTDTVPIHSWLLPWLHTLGDRLLDVFRPIRQKLSKALRLWNPLDKSAMLMLRPWVPVWSAATMSAFLTQNIVPKLEKALAQMSLDPAENGKYPEFAAALDWLEMISPEIIANVFGKYFFPRWYDTLCIWLDSPGANPHEVKLWYVEWQQKILPFPQLMEYPSIKENLRRALVAMAESGRGVRVSSQALLPPLTAMPPPPPPNRLGGPAVPGPRPPPAAQLTVRDILEQTAMKHGITYCPQAGRMREGKPVYWFGTISLYIHQGVVYAMDVDNFEWYPITLDRLLQKSGIGV